ncbi:MAG: imidazole glycerol phosphate synthase subunit HisH [Flavobacteriia bacterium]|nr:imidazole glycerol phosphate synthase subunit HisH [Flavobacteriia bacterium]
MIVIVDYKMGNLGSITNIIKKVGYQSVVSSDVEVIKKATKLILPGVGSFDKAMQNLKELELIGALNEKVIIQKTPILGICLGMQLLGNYSEEGNVSGLGWIDAEIKKFQLKSFPELKVPHMGWNEVLIPNSHPLCENLPDPSRFYFVHSYHAVCKNQTNVLMKTHFGYDFDSAIHEDNIMGVQFHPEKSHKFGMQLIKNFIEKC